MSWGTRVGSCGVVGGRGRSVQAADLSLETLTCCCISFSWGHVHTESPQIAAKKKGTRKFKAARKA